VGRATWRSSVAITNDANLSGSGTGSHT
jgi:hypothetical protein